MQRQALAGLLWSQQYYHFVVEEWLEGDPGQPKPPASRLKDATRPGFTSITKTCSRCPTSGSTRGMQPGILAFHMIPLALVDPDNAKAQLRLFLREWYMHPNGQIAGV